MYIPKLMLLIFNFILLVIGLIAISRGLSDYIPYRLKALENALDIVYLHKVMLFGGCVILFVAFLGFWGAEMENRTALITYKILICFVIGVQLILIFYFTFNEDSIHGQINQQLAIWVEEYEKNKHQMQLENVQNYLKCKEANSTISLSGKTTESCTDVAFKYFTTRTKVYLWFMGNIIGPEVAALIFADMVAKKILMLQNIMLGKLGSS